MTLANYKLTSFEKLESISWEGWVTSPRMKLSNASSSYISKGANWWWWSRSDLSLFPNKLKKLKKQVYWRRCFKCSTYLIAGFTWYQVYETYSIWPCTKLWPNLKAAVANTFAIDGFTVGSYCFWYPVSIGFNWLSSIYFEPKNLVYLRFI